MLIDSQSIKIVADNEERGIDGGKNKMTQASCLVDTMGNLLGIVAHVTNMHDKKSGILVAKKVYEKYS